MSRQTSVSRNVRWYERRYAKGYKLLRWDIVSPSHVCASDCPSPSQSGVYWALRPAMQPLLALQYRMGRWTAPLEGWGPLGVFASVLTALAFAAKYNGRFCLAKCYYEPTPSDHERTFWALLVRGQYAFPPRGDLSLPAEDVWERRYAKCNIPEGTRYADRLILTRLLPEQELCGVEGVVGGWVVREGRTPRWGKNFSAYQQYGLPLDWHDPRTLE